MSSSSRPLIVACLLVAGAGALLRAAGPEHPRATHAFTVVASANPHLLLMDGTSRSVRVTLRNDGTQTWVPEAGYSLSYHWRTAFERLVERDGARTRLAGPVGPGHTTTLDGELGLPPGPGLYVLEWDMVQEQVAWFSERDPRPLARTLVMVLPSPAWLWSLLPLLSALAALTGLLLVHLERSPRRAPARASWLHAAGSRLAPFSDLAWCAVALLVKQVAVLGLTKVEVTPGALAISTLLAFAPAALVLGCVPRRARAWAAWLVVAAASLVLLADVVYFRYFGDVLSVAALSAATQVWRLRASIRSLLGPEDLFFVLDLAVALPLAWKLSRARFPAPGWPARAAVSAAPLLVLLIAAPASLSRRVPGEAIFRHLDIVRTVGPFGYHLGDALRSVRVIGLRPTASAAEIAEARSWFAERAERRAGTGPYFGAARGRNLVFVLAESLQGFVVGLRVNGLEVTPNLNRLRGEAVWSSQVVDQAAEGRTSDAELLNAASLLPLAHGAAAFHHAGNRFVTLPRLLAERGYSTYSAVPFDGSFWNRRVTHAAYGFARSDFAEDFEPGTREGWGLDDRSFLRQARAKLARLQRPFCSWLITLSLHHPFDQFPDELKSMDLGPWNGTRFGNYLHAAHLFDQALGELVEGMRADGLLDDTLLVVEGDHEAGVEWAHAARATGVEKTTLQWYLADRVPLLIRVPGPGAPRGELPVVVGQLDVAPTLAALLGIDPKPLPFLGRNLLGKPGEEPVVRRYGDWVDASHLYLSGQGYTSKPACFDLATRGEAPLSACAGGTREAERQIRVSASILAYDLQPRLRPAGN